MEKGSKKRKIEYTRWIWIKVIEWEWSKKVKTPWISENITSLSVETEDSSEYDPNKQYLKNLKVEIKWIEWNSDSFMNFIRSS